MASFKYEQVRIQNTYAWITETANSNPISATKIAKGISVTTATSRELVNSCAKNVERILSRVWPATMLANNRTPSETARAMYEISSISTNNGTSARGVPDGIKYEKKCNPCFCSPRIVTPRKIVTDSPIDTTIDVVTVNP